MQNLSLIPQFILEQFEQRAYHGNLAAAVVFVDISGFTQLTETLMQHQKDGAEVLTTALNRIFNPLVDQVYARGGFITTFAGDAFTALFPATPDMSAPMRALYAAWFIQAFFAGEGGELETPYGRFVMQVKLGLAYGAVKWGLLGNREHFTYFFRGDAVDACAQAEHLAEKGELVVDARVLPYVQSRGVIPVVETVEAGYVRIGVPQDEYTGAEPPLPTPLSRAVLMPFVLDAVIDLMSSDVRGEFRNVTSVFISFDVQSLPYAPLNVFVPAAINLAIDYGGYFNKLDFGDKGGVMLVLFGAPIAHENDLERAASFLLALREQMMDVRWRAGVTIGSVYAGVVGGQLRCEYTAIGDMVNLAARLMQAAAWGQIWVSASVAERLRELFMLESLGMYTFKGKRDPLPAYLLIERRALVAAPLYTGDMVGRAAEVAQLTRFVEDVVAGQFAGIIYVYGEAGVGKSRLVYEVRRRCTMQRWLLCQAEEILRRSLNPFKQLLFSYFDQSPDRVLEANQSRFERRLDVLIANTHAAGREDIAWELDRTRSFLGALVDLYWEGSLYDQLDPQLRFQNILAAFKVFIQAESVQLPLILHIEDVHCLDADSMEMLKFLTRNMMSYSFGIICSGRYQDDGGQIQVEVERTVPQHVIVLQPMKVDDIRTCAERILGDPVADSLTAFLAEKTSGNPFFIEQLVLELRERKAMVREIGEMGPCWQLTPHETLHIPATVNAVLVARLDRLRSRVRQAVQTAAVLGREFDVQILSRMLAGDIRRSVVKQAEMAAIWKAETELHYVFLNALLRDAAYDMQLRARLREFHRLAGEAIEHFYGANLAPHYANLAYHYRRAELAERERHYTWLAGKWAAAQFANVEAIHYVSRALELTPEADRTARYELLAARERLYSLQGSRAVQARDLADLESLAEALGDDHKRAEIAIRRALYAEALGEYGPAITAAQQAIAWARVAQQPRWAAMGYLRWGEALRRRSDYDGAQAQIAQAMALLQDVQMPQVAVEAQRARGIVAYYQGDYGAAKASFTQALHVARDISDRAGEGAALNSLGAVFDALGDYDTARNYYQQSLAIRQAIGDRWGEVAALNNLGRVAAYQGDYAASRAYQEHALRICREIGDRAGEGTLLHNLGDTFLNHGHYAEAQTYAEQALLIRQEIGDRRGEGAALGNLGQIAMGWGDYARSERDLTQALMIFREIGNRERESLMLANLGLLYHLRGNDDTARQYSQQALVIARELGDRRTQGYALAHVGHAWLGLGHLDEAAAAYQQSLALRDELGEPNLVIESKADLARVALEQGNLPQAQAYVAEVIAHLESGNLDGTEQPFLIYMTCYQTLLARHDPRALKLLDDARALLAERAARIVDPAMQRVFVDSVAHLLEQV